MQIVIKENFQIPCNIYISEQTRMYELIAEKNLRVEIRTAALS